MTQTPVFTGRCYCGAMAYRAAGAPLYKAQCHCRPCQYFTGGGPSILMLMPKSGFRWISGTPASFTRKDLPVAATRYFCGTCGTHLVNTLPGREHVVIRVGTLDDPAAFGGPQAAVRMRGAQPFHRVAAGVPCFDDVPPR